MLPLRISKSIDVDSLKELNKLLSDVTTLYAESEMIPRQLTGNLWFIFTSMLSEAEHTRNLEPILNIAWELQEKLRRIFGPRFSSHP